MHELSIVLSIIESAEEQVRKHGANQVESIDLAIGELAGIERLALDFAWEAAAPDTVLSHAQLNIIAIPARARCMDCGHEFPVQELYEACPKCGEYFTDIIQGKELKIQSMTLI